MTKAFCPSFLSGRRALVLGVALLLAGPGDALLAQEATEAKDGSKEATPTKSVVAPAVKAEREVTAPESGKSAGSSEKKDASNQPAASKPPAASTAVATKPGSSVGKPAVTPTVNKPARAAAKTTGSVKVRQPTRRSRLAPATPKQQGSSGVRQPVVRGNPVWAEVANGAVLPAAQAGLTAAERAVMKPDSAPPAGARLAATAGQGEETGSLGIALTGETDAAVAAIAVANAAQSEDVLVGATSLPEYRLPGTEQQDTPLGTLMLGITLKLAAVVALIFVAALIWRRLQRMTPRPSAASDGRLQVLETTALGANRHLSLVAAGGRRLLIGATPNQISLLADVTPEPESARIEDPRPGATGVPTRQDELDELNGLKGLGALIGESPAATLERTERLSPVRATLSSFQTMLDEMKGGSASHSVAAADDTTELELPRMTLPGAQAAQRYGASSSPAVSLFRKNGRKSQHAAR